MGTVAAYDQIADWYETEFLVGSSDADTIGINRSLRDLLGAGSGTCLEIGCGTGVHAAAVRDLGWTPIGVDLSTRMLRYAIDRLPAMRADAEALPFPDATFDAVIAMMVHTDMPAYPRVLHEAARVLRPGGAFVHVGVHPCFCGGFADGSDQAALVIRPGYLEHYWTKDSWNTNGVRDKVGASHWPLPQLLTMFLDAGLVFERFTEGGEPTPVTFSVGCRKPA